VPTVFNVPAHLKTVQKHRKAPAVRRLQEPQVTCTTAATADEPQQPEQQQPSTSVTEHEYLLPSPRKLKRRLDAATDALQLSKKRLKVSQQKTRRLAKKLETVTDILDDLRSKELLSQQAAESLSSSFSGPALDLVMRCLSKSSRQPMKSYPAELRTFALTLQFYSARAYDYVRKIFGKCLPHPQTLSSWYRCVGGNAGFHDEVFSALKARAEGSSDGRLLCSFMMDEIAIRKQLDFDSSADKFVGYVDMGVDVDDKAGLPVANEALMFMVVSLTDSWKIPVGYFLIAGLHGAERANLVKLCLEKLYAVGVHVVSITFDGCSANVNMANMLGASFDMQNVKSTFPHPSNANLDVAVFLDVCHMLKLLRNTLAEKSTLIDADGNKIEWQYLKNLQQLQCSEGLQAANKVTSRHIQWHRQKMKVKLAAQTLSSSAADAIEFCDKHLKREEFRGSDATVTFIRTADRLFDILNSRNVLSRGFKAPLRVENEGFWRPFLVSAVNYLKGLTLSNGQLVSNSLRKTCVVGFVVSATSALFLFDTHVKQQQQLKYLLTYKFSQDHLELFFALIRSRGGHNNNPSPLQLKATIRRLLTHNKLICVSTGNCLPVDSCKLLSINDCITRLQTTAETDIDTVSCSRRYDVQEQHIGDDDDVDHDYLPRVESLSTFVENVVVYIAGFVVKKLKSKICCPTCQLALTSNEKLGDTYRADFCLIEQRDRGGLVRPSCDVIAVCKSTERYLRMYTGAGQRPTYKKDNVSLQICSKVLSDFIGCPIFTSLADHAIETEAIDNHQVQLIRTVANCYVTLRLRHQCKSYTHFVQGESCRSVLNKTVLFKGQ